jgi:3'(2'), 5'-bisphosphate nucleotidase
MKLTSDEIKFVNNVAREAGKKILDIYMTSYDIEIKSDMSPITLADKTSNSIIENRLTEKFPNIPILSEEGNDIPFTERKKWKKFWLIDPLDGTKEFIKKNGEFTINIALIYNNYPTFGCVYAPFFNNLYWAFKGMGAYKINENNKKKRIKVKPSSDIKRIVTSRSHLNKEVLNFINKHHNYELIKMGSSLKLCCIADGKADLYPRLGLTSEWDIGAAQCVVEEAGGSVLEYTTSKRLRYNKKNILNPFFIVSA